MKKQNPLEILQEDNGRFSSNRLVFLLWSIAVLIIWIITSLNSNTLQSIPESIVTIILILMTGKVVQKIGECKNEIATEKTSQISEPSLEQGDKNVKPICKK